MAKRLGWPCRLKIGGRAISTAIVDISGPGSIGFFRFEFELDGEIDAALVVGVEFTIEQLKTGKLANHYEGLNLVVAKRWRSLQTRKLTIMTEPAGR